MPEFNGAEYMATGGSHCPWCGSTDFCGEEIHIDEANAWQTVSCSYCGGAWNDIYSLSDVSPVRPPDDDRLPKKKSELPRDDVREDDLA